jgi:ubiquinone/menaquinone biosynthesis C-methylase UbiE
LTTLRTKWSTYIDQQHRHPHGRIGQFIGERMRRQHMPETTWSIELLKLQPTDRILEIGFGAGRGLALALQQSRHGHVTGLDLSSTMIHVAARRNRAAYRSGHLTLLRGDIVALPFQHHRFDKIVSIHTFYFWPEPYARFGQILSVLRKGGRLVTTFATARTLRSGKREYWPLHDQAQALVHDLQQHCDIQAELVFGPDSRQFNNVAIVIDKL